jgi:hypothetical protein
MNAGRDYAKAKRQAQANANRVGFAYWLHGYNGHWWIERARVGDVPRESRELIRPEPDTRPAVNTEPGTTPNR